MDDMKIVGVVGANLGLAGFRGWLQDHSADISVVLLLLQCLVALVTVLYIGTKVWKMWKGRK